MVPGQRSGQPCQSVAKACQRSVQPQKPVSRRELRARLDSPSCLGREKTLGRCQLYHAAKLIFFLIASIRLFAADETALIRHQENALADAVSAHDRAAISALVDNDFHVDWSYGSTVQSFLARVTREDWLEMLSSQRLDSYDIEIKRIDRSGQNAVQVMLNEFLVLRLPRRRLIHKRVETFDMWVKKHDAWRLTSRLCHSDTQY